MKSAMGSWLIMGLNVLLLGGSCFLVADIVTRIGAEALEPVPLASAPPDREAAPADARLVAPSVILERNLFGAQLAGDVQALPPERDADEPLADTKLPLRLLGTAAASVEERSRAAIEDEKTRKHLVVAVGDSIEGHPRVSVAAIERTRVVLDNAGKREQLLLNEDQPLPQVAMARARPARRTAARPARTDTLNDRLQALSGEEGKGISEILSSARIVPHYAGGEMLGMKVDAIKPDSIFQRAGLQNGDVITEVNDIVIDRIEATSAIFDELASADQVTFSALRGDSTIQLSATADELLQE